MCCGHVPLLWSRQVGFFCTIATRSFSTWAPSPHLLFFSHTPLFRRGLGVLTTWAVDPKFVITFKVDVLSPMVRPLVVGAELSAACGARRRKRGADQPRSPNRGFLDMWVPSGSERGPRALYKAMMRSTVTLP